MCYIHLSCLLNLEQLLSPFHGIDIFEAYRLVICSMSFLCYVLVRLYSASFSQNTELPKYEKETKEGGS